MSARPAAPVAVLGCPAFDHADHLEAALASLRAQTRDDFLVVALDDGSTDATPQILRAVAEADPRFLVRRSEERLGLVGAWQAVYDWAREAAPDAPYFAWVSDHDLWEPEWLERLVGALEADPDAVLACPVAVRIDEHGAELGRTPAVDTTACPDRRSRLLAVHRAQAGSMVYGLMRADAVVRAGGFRRVLEPDRLLLAELAVQGTFVAVDEPLWQRRYARVATVQRQRRAIFLGRRVPARYLPGWVLHPLLLVRRAGLRDATAYGRTATQVRLRRRRHEYRERRRASQRRMRRRRKQLRRWRRRRVKRLAKAVGRVPGLARLAGWLRARA